MTSSECGRLGGGLGRAPRFLEDGVTQGRSSAVTFIVTPSGSYVASRSAAMI